MPATHETRTGAEAPAITFPESLPISAHREEIAEALAGHQLIVVAGETGSGKTTQLPKLCLALGRGQDKRIGHTQPRRLAARSVAARVAEELGTTLGDRVGFQVRFHDQVSDATAIKLMTDGILLAELQRDRDLNQYDTLIIDEAHERSLNIDFILGYLKRLLPRRPDLKVIITSATIDVDSFSRHFDDAPVIEVSGRGYPVSVHYLEPARDEESAEQVVSAVRDIRDRVYGEPGDVLVFLPGERDIRDLSRRLRPVERVEVLPLYARLGHREQARVFDTTRRRSMRVVLATNVAETSLTVPGIRYVIDTGEARISRYSYRSRIQRLPIEPVSQASADQRKGRCGRIAPGVCLRLYSEEDFERRPRFTEPEIQRTNLAAVILQMLQLGLGKVSAFPFIDPPERKRIRVGYRLLEELGAVDGRGRITRVGRRMARLPIDPSLARMVLAAERYGVLAEVLVIASALAVQDPRERPPEKSSQADQAHARFRHPQSDFLDWLALWRYAEDQRQQLSQNQFRKLCQREFLSYLRLREWRDHHTQLVIACRQQGLKPGSSLPDEESQDYRGIHKALLAGLLANVAQQDERREYLGTRNRRLQVFPGSNLYRKPPKWLVAAEIVETQRVYARMAGAIEPQWLLDINPDLLKHHYYEPRWQRGSGRVVAFRRTTLFGLTVSDRETVNYGPIDPEISRTLMIREGLIAGRWRKPPSFLQHNLALVESVQDMEARTRRRDILVDEQILFDFYDERLPAECVSAAHLAGWLKREPGADSTLRMSKAMLLARAPASGFEGQFPDHIEWRGQSYPLSYAFDPGGLTDGVTVTVPVALLNRVPRHLFEWLVPGLLREKCVQLVKGLPKSVRRQLVPVPDTVDEVIARMEPDDVPLTLALSRALRDTRGVKVADADWQPAALDDFYSMNVRVVDSDGRLLEQGRSLADLISRFRSDTARELEAAPASGPAQTGLTRWEPEEIPERWQFRQAGVEIEAYPGLADRGQAVDIVLFDYPEQALREHRLGLARLLQLQLSAGVRYLRKNLLRGNAASLQLAGLGLDRETLLADLITAIVLDACGVEDGGCRTRADFDAAVKRGRGIAAVASEWERVLGNTLQPLAGAAAQLAGAEPSWAPAVEDVNAQVRGLLGPGVLAEVPRGRFEHYPRYARAIAHRIERFNAQWQKDQSHQAAIARLQAPLAELLAERPALLLVCPAAADYRWMLEEFRVSLFAQHLGTSQRVSEKRLAEIWQRVQEWCLQNPR